MAECKEELTGRILQTETNGNDFVLDAASQPSRWKPKQGWRSVLEVAAVVGLVALLATVIALAVVLSRNNSNRGIDPACIHALGGGPIKNGGSMEIKAPDYCKAQLRAYADNSRGSYWREVDVSMLAAMATFGFAHKSTPQQPTSPPHRQQHAGIAMQAQLRDSGSSSSFTSKLSRSLLSTAVHGRQQQQPGLGSLQAAGQMASEQGAYSASLMLGGPVAAAAAREGLQAPVPGPDKVVVFDIDETVLSNMPQIMDPVTWSWDKWVAAAAAPALQPSLRFYNALCDAGYSVAFITGRKESSRNSTMHNLEIEGYGKPCVPGPGPYYGVRPAGSSMCCYSALYLREAGDTSLASVYKPGARTDLLKRGNMTLVALVGDQFSDLNGEESAPYAFKLPNPFYYIL